MLEVTRLKKYPIAGVEGYSVERLVLHPTHIEGNRVFAVVPTDEVKRWQDDPDSGLPVRMSQTNYPELAGLTTKERLGVLHILRNKRSINTGIQLRLKESSKPSLETLNEAETITQLLNEYVIPIRASKRSITPRWAEYCGDEVSSWLSDVLERQVVLMKAVLTPDLGNAKNHFTWYTFPHLIVQETVDALRAQIGYVHEDQFRENIVVKGEKAWGELNWDTLSLRKRQRKIEMDTEDTERCPYMIVEPGTGHKYEDRSLITTLFAQRNKLMGKYLKVRGLDYPVVVKVRNRFEVTYKS